MESSRAAPSRTEPAHRIGAGCQIMNRFRDPVVLTLGVLLLSTLAAFAVGVVPYPFGWMVLCIFLMARILSRP
jgi:hypothetical protein